LLTGASTVQETLLPGLLPARDEVFEGVGGVGMHTARAGSGVQVGAWSGVDVWSVWLSLEVGGGIDGLTPVGVGAFGWVE